MHSDAVDTFKKFVELVDAPVALSLMGQCAFDSTDKRYIGMLGCITKHRHLLLANVTVVY